MRAPVLSVVMLSLVLAGGCAEKPQEAASRAQVSPIAPLLDWSSVAGRNPPGRASDDDAKPAKAKGAAAAVPVAIGEKEPAPAPSRAGAVNSSVRHALFTRLPKDALLVIDLPDVASLRSGFQASELGRLMQQPQIRTKLVEMQAQWDKGLDQARKEVPELAPALELLPKLGGRLVIAVSGLTAESLAASPADMPWCICVVYDAGEQADRVAEVCAPLFSSLAKQHKWPLLEKQEPAWGCEIGDTRFMLDFERIGNQFELHLGGRNSVMRELIALRKRTELGSFYAARVAKDASNVEALGASELAEVHLQLTSLWEALCAGGNRDDIRALSRTGLMQLHGASIAVGRTKSGLAEALTLHSPAGIDLITHLLTGQPMDTTLARCVPAGLPNAGLYGFDGTRVVADLCLMMPREAQSGLVRALAEFRRNLGVDFERDLLSNIGPTIALATSGFSLFDQGLPRIPDVFLALQLADATRAQSALTALVLASGKSDAVQGEFVDGLRVNSITIPLEGIASELKLNWCISDSVFFASTRMELLQEALRGLHNHDISNAGLRAAIEKAGNESFAASFTRGDANTPDAITIGRRTNAGLELTSSDGVAMQSTVASMFCLGIASSVAIPSLLKLRHDANEQAASSRLVVINDAETMARAGNLIDADRDGRGESLFLQELCGANALRSGAKALSEPWLANDFEWVSAEVGLKSGFCFRVDLPSTDGGGVSSVAALAKHPLALDSAEERCVAYAWPVDLEHGSAVFVFDSEGGLYRSDNRGEGQHYAGDRAPATGAHWTDAGKPGEATRYVGRDGGIWLRLRPLADREPTTR